MDHKTKLDPNGKGVIQSALEVRSTMTSLSVIADIAHMPGSVCGTWPAFWSTGKNWPGDGEIDIIEGVNLQDHNEIVMHTAGTCSLTDTDMTGVVNATGCGEDLGTVGCVIEGHKGSYGTSFNGQGGGVYAMQWTDKSSRFGISPGARSRPPSLAASQMSPNSAPPWPWWRNHAMLRTPSSLSPLCLMLLSVVTGLAVSLAAQVAL